MKQTTRKFNLGKWPIILCDNGWPMIAPHLVLTYHKHFFTLVSKPCSDTYKQAIMVQVKSGDVMNGIRIHLVFYSRMKKQKEIANGSLYHSWDHRFYACTITACLHIPIHGFQDKSKKTCYWYVRRLLLSMIGWKKHVRKVF